MSLVVHEGEELVVELVRRPETRRGEGGSTSFIFLANAGENDEADEGYYTDTARWISCCILHVSRCAQARR